MNKANSWAGHFSNETNITSNPFQDFRNTCEVYNIQRAEQLKLNFTTDDILLGFHKTFSWNLK